MLPAGGEGDGVGGEGGQGRGSCDERLALRSRSQRKNGAPIAGRDDADRKLGRSDDGAREGCRPAERAALRRRSAQAGRSARWSGPIAKSRSRCGTTMPTKPITPAAATLAPTAAATRTTIAVFARSTGTPR